MTIQTLGDYTLLKKIGSGGFGSVYLAEHRFIKKKFVLKIISSELSSKEEFIQRFEKDVGILATLDHPSIVKVHDISYADDHYFLVTDACVDRYGDVTNLAQFMERKQELSENQIETILRQIASALDYAHSIRCEDAYLVHRGLKLSNILVDDNEKGLRVFLTDFGLSRLIGEAHVLSETYKLLLNELATSKSNGNFLQNFSFLSPEQKNETTVDIKTDIYAFGILTYYLISKKFPEGYFDLPSKLSPKLQLNWDLLIAKCLQPDKEKRPLMLVDALNLYLPNSPANGSSLDVLSWDEVGRKVENAMQMSFEFSVDESQNEDLSIHKNIKKTEKQTDKEISPKPILHPSEIERPQYEPDPGAIFLKELNVSVYKPEKEEIKNINPIMTEMVIIPGGAFYRGSNDGARDEAPNHCVTVNSFALDIHPVTNEQFIRFLESMGGEKDCNNNDIIILRHSRIKRSGGKIIIEAGYAKHPVVGISWYGAHAYAKWIGKRLPTEAEWEIAATGNLQGTLYPSGKDIDRTTANFFNSDTTAVMSYSPNGYGLFDVAGNVYEWCEDWYAYNYYDTSVQEPDNPKGPPQGVYRVLRGGCWKSLKEDLRCSHRHRNNPGTVNGTYGFRCATDVS